MRDGAPSSGGGGVGYRVPRSRFGARHKLGRLVWGVVQGTVFRWSPRPCFGWRRWLLSLFGAKLSARARVYPRARVWAPWNLQMGDFATIADDVDVYCVDRITLGERAIVSQYSYLCGATHDFEDERRPLVPKPIVIGRRCWVAADVFVGPGVELGEGCVVGARSSVFSDLPGWSVCVGSPAKVVRTYEVRAGAGAMGSGQ
jgi:putative colanic acid biosynthesis acetyltransferase WcaF